MQPPLQPAHTSLPPPLPVRSKLQEALAWQPPPPPMVMRQLCAVLAAAVGGSGGEGVTELAMQAVVLLGGQQPGLGLALLTALAQEAEDLDRVRRLALVNVLRPHMREVLAALGGLLGARGATAADATLSAATLQCVGAWLQLTPAGGGGCFMPPGELRAQQPALFSVLLAAATAPPGAPEALVEAAVQVLLLAFGADSFSKDEALDAAAIDDLLVALLSLRGRLGAGCCCDAQPAAVAALGSAAAERAPEHVAGVSASALPFSALMLECLERWDPGVVEAALDYFLTVNTGALGAMWGRRVGLVKCLRPPSWMQLDADHCCFICSLRWPGRPLPHSPPACLRSTVPLAERPPELGPPLYKALLLTLTRHVSLPPSFSSWAEVGSEVDEDSFHRLRETLLPEALEVAYGLLRRAYLSHAWALLTGAANWQSAEAALYLLRAVALPVRTRVLADPAAPDPPPDVVADRAATAELLAALFGQQVCSEAGAARLLGGHPLLAAAACRLLQDYAVWLGRADGAPVQGALALLLRALALPPPVAPAAASAFQALCLRCAWKLRDPGVVASLMQAAHGVLSVQQQQQRQGGAAGGLAIAHRQLVVEGLARVAAGLQGQVLQEAAAALTRPFIDRAAAAAAAGGNAGAPPSAAARAALADNLRLLAAALRFLAPAGDDSGAAAAAPVAAVLEQAGPTLRAVGETPCWNADDEVAAAAAEVYCRCIGSARRHGKALLPALLPPLGVLFAATGQPGCLDALGEALELHFEDPGAVDALAGELDKACGAAFPRLQARGLREQPGLAAALLGLAHQFAAYAPVQLSASGLLPPLLSLAAAAAQLREAEPCARALALLAALLGAHRRCGDEGPPRQAGLDAALAGGGEALVRALLAALCDTCPRHLMRTAADCLRAVVGHPTLGGAAPGWLATTLSSGALPGMAEGYLSPEDCAAFGALAGGDALRGPRLTALVVDFGLIARGQQTNDCLLAYEM